MIEQTAPDPTDLNLFGVLVVTSTEHFESSFKSDNSARHAVITQLSCQLSIVAADQVCCHHG